MFLKEPLLETDPIELNTNTALSADHIAEAMIQYLRDSAFGRIVDLPRWVQ